MTMPAGSAAATGLPFTAPWLLAPMEGVTEPLFRTLLLERNGPESLGGAFTEFVRISGAPIPLWKMRDHLGSARFPQPVGLQLMGSHLDHLAQSARNAVEAGAPLVDLNFGCPAKGALRGCAGAALLDDPPQIERIVRCVREAVPAVPVTAKIRAGGDDASRVEELARAAEQGGAAMLTVHCRTRAEGYQEQVDWGRIARAAAAVHIPVCGNGGIRAHSDLERMRRQTGARFAMVGRAALGDPWIFSGRTVAPAEAAAFLVSYFDRLLGEGVTARGALGCVKQLVSRWTAGRLFGPNGESRPAIEAFLRQSDPAALIGGLRSRACADPPIRDVTIHGSRPSLVEEGGVPGVLVDG
jgi:tRNA-dihydrouridine synthase